ncbi:hypothetical protein [Bacillus sp. FJAT-22090]|uniref:hypothetical protein n=1 Tax=Bacillus sp. FJAT-22090 TaxID=1581038 RepID=UPI0011A3FA16|nr:hypothetical protein [Bacillus sp. FJAT-22090]
MFKKSIVFSYITLLLLLLLLGCSQSVQVKLDSENVNPNNELRGYLAEKYGEEFDWEIGDGKKYALPISVDMNEGVLDRNRSLGMNLEPYVGEQLPVYGYNLKPKCFINDIKHNFVLIILKNQDDTEFIGEYLTLSGTEGGGIPIQNVDDAFSENNCAKSK